MAYQPSPSTFHAHADRVPDELLAQLHGVNERLHQGREQLESAMEGHEMRHQERIDAAAEELRRGQREWEDVNRKIHDALHPPA